MNYGMIPIRPRNHAAVVVGARDMDASLRERSAAELRDYLAEERTFLAWIRTGIALMGFGIVLAHFGLFEGESQPTPYGFRIQPHEFSLWFGAALIAVGVTVNLFSVRRYVHLVKELNRGQFVQRSVSKQGVVVAMFLALIGIAMAVYMVLIVAPHGTLHA
jgi:putative membrane protein